MFESSDKVGNIRDIMLIIRVKCHNILPSVLRVESANKLKSCLKGSSSATIDYMTNIENLCINKVSENFSRSIHRAIINDKNIGKTGSKDPLDYNANSSSFIV